MGIWSAHAAAAFVGGLIFIGGASCCSISIALAIMQRYGSLVRALGLDSCSACVLSTIRSRPVVVSTMVVIINVLGILVGAVVLVMTLLNIYAPSVAFDALLMKN